MSAFQSHPSVRIRGTENEFEPVSCMDMDCPKKLHHWHCPLCQKAEVYSDPLILKAHYRVKHVDKGIEFAGLKILRCCQKCEIVGTIKGCKDFKSAHWHCYRCRNGFNRRDEAIKHYKTHFRNPQTTFQIQIAQDINAALVKDPQILHIAPDVIEEQPLHTTGYVSQTPQRMQTVNMKISPMGELHSSVAAEETVGLADDQTVIIIEHTTIGDQQHRETSGSVEEVMQESQEIECDAMTSFGEATYSVNLLEERDSYMKQVEELHNHIEDLKAENANLEEKLSEMRAHLEKQSLASQRREQELLQQLMQPLPERTMNLFNQLKADHESLLHSHLQAVQQVSESDSPFQNYVQIKDAEGTEMGPMFIVESIKSDRDQSTEEAEEEVEEEVEEATSADDKKPDETDAKRKAGTTSPGQVVKKLRFDL